VQKCFLVVRQLALACIIGAVVTAMPAAAQPAAKSEQFASSSASAAHADADCFW